MMLRILLIFSFLIRLEPSYASSDDVIEIEKNSEESSLIYLTVGLGTIGLSILSYFYMHPEQRKNVWKYAKKYFPGLGGAAEAMPRPGPDLPGPGSSSESSLTVIAGGGRSAVSSSASSSSSSEAEKLSEEGYKIISNEKEMSFNDIYSPVFIAVKKTQRPKFIKVQADSHISHVNGQKVLIIPRGGTGNFEIYEVIPIIETAELAYAAYKAAKEKKDRKQIDLLRQAAEMGHVQATRDYVVMLEVFSQTNPDQYLHLYRIYLKRSAEQGNRNSILDLAIDYFEGTHGFSVDREIVNLLYQADQNGRVPVLPSPRQFLVTPPQEPYVMNPSLDGSRNPESVSNLYIPRVNAGGAAHSFTHASSRHPTNEDRFVSVTMPSGIRYHGVFDGHGLGTVSDTVSSFLSRELHRFLDWHREEWVHNPDRLRYLFVEFDAIVREQLGQQAVHGARNAGSTATMMIDLGERDGRVIIINLGDSPALVVNRSGEVFRSTDHDPITNQGEAEYIRQEIQRNDVKKAKLVKDGIEVEIGDRHFATVAMSRSFGDNSFKPPLIAEPNIYVINRSQIAFVALMSDGVGEALQDSKGSSHPKESVEGVAQTLNDLMRTHQEDPNFNPAEAFFKGLRRIGKDDITILVIPFGQ